MMETNGSMDQNMELLQRAVAMEQEIRIPQQEEEKQQQPAEGFCI